MVTVATPVFERVLKQTFSGEIMFDAFSRARYATDASIYQMMPIGVVLPKTEADIEAALATARKEKIPILSRGGGTSQCGQTVNEALVIDNSKYFNKILELDVENRRCVVQPGIVLDELNRALKPHGLWFPIDVSTASRATIGGMAGNNSCGGRSLRYGIMRDNVISIDAILPNGTKMKFGPLGSDAEAANVALVRELLNLGAREAEEISTRFPKVLRRVGGYNIDALVPSINEKNLSHILVGSEGTLAYSTAIELKLSPIPTNKVMGVCHFASFYEAMDATQHIVALDPQAVELVDSTMIALARDIPLFQSTIEEFVEGHPEALLLVEFSEDTEAQNLTKLRDLGDLLGDLGFSWRHAGRKWGGLVSVTEERLQANIAEMRKSGLNIMMSMKDAGKPISFVEDCAVALPDLAEYTDGLTNIFEKYGTRGTWYAHASVGCLHVRPVLNMKLDKDIKTMRDIAEEAFELVRRYKGSHSGEHGDGIVRSEFHEQMFGSRMVRAFGEVKKTFDPDNLFNPGKIVDPPKMDDRSKFRYHNDYLSSDIETKLDWSAWAGSAGGFQGAVEMCNNNGACRKLEGGTMCPSYRASRNERDVTRGRANALRLALSGQLGKDALTSDDMIESMKFCVSCKGCKRECPTGVDMTAMKIEVLDARTAKYGLSLHDRLVAFLPRYAPHASRIAGLMNLRNSLPGLSKLLERPTGFTAKRNLPRWHVHPFSDNELVTHNSPDAVLLADCFNRYFEPENLRAGVRVLNAAGKRIGPAIAAPGHRPLCCGRTFLASGLVDEAISEARRLLRSLLPFAKNGVPIVGLEPSCLLTLRDEIPRLLPGEDADRIADQAKMFEEYIVETVDAGRLQLALKSSASEILLHGHCHQKAMGIMSSVEKTLNLIPDTQVKTVETSCCGMAGAFGYGTETYETSMAMAELDLLPKIREQGDEVLVVADGTSCRQQIAFGVGKSALHVARVVDMALRQEEMN
ncbi:MAG: FAD-binding and (Fe-S)-binding domain-containing protein [Hyphomicrobiales bacterium]